MANKSASERLREKKFVFHEIARGESGSVFGQTVGKDVVLLADALREVAALEAERDGAYKKGYDKGQSDLVHSSSKTNIALEARARALEDANAALTAELQACYQDQCRWCGDGLRVERRMGPEINGWSWPFWIHCEEGEPRGIGCRAFTARERAYQQEQAAILLART